MTERDAGEVRDVTWLLWSDEGEEPLTPLASLQARVRAAERARLDPESLALWDAIHAPYF